MTDPQVIWNISEDVRGTTRASDFRDYLLGLLCLRHLSDKYEEAVKRELGEDWVPLGIWYQENDSDIAAFEAHMLRKLHWVLRPKHLWANIIRLADKGSGTLLRDLQETFRFIEAHSLDFTFHGLFSHVDIDSRKLGGNYEDRNAKLCKLIQRLSDVTIDGEVIEHLIGRFATVSNNEFYTPRGISEILASVVTMGRSDLGTVLDFTCGSGSLLLNVRQRMKQKEGVIGPLYGQDIDGATCNLARMNMLMHGLKPSEFEIYRGDTLANDWDMFRETSPSKIPRFDAIVASPPFSLRWDPDEDVRFKDYGAIPKYVADFAFLLHGLHYLKDDGAMAIVLHVGALFRGGVEQQIRRKLLEDGHIDAVIGLPAGLCYSTGAPVCIVVLKKRRQSSDVLCINARNSFEKGKRQNRMTDEHVSKIIDTYQYRKQENIYSRRVEMDEIVRNGYNLNLGYVDGATNY